MIDTPPRKPRNGFRYAPFGFWVAVQLVIVLASYSYLFPWTFNQERHDIPALLLTIFFLGLPLSFFEYVYHRYLLHEAMVSLLKSMCKAHREHHRITPVVITGIAKPVKNNFPIEHEDQEHAMEFPRYALSIFYALFLAFLALPLKLAFPNAPVILGTIVAVTFSYGAYEVWHAILHLPAAQWEKYLYHHRYSRIFQRIYAFHWMHHWKHGCNMAVVGFYGFALWDYVFKTHMRLKYIPRQGEGVKGDSLPEIKPWNWLTQLDKYISKLSKKNLRPSA